MKLTFRQWLEKHPNVVVRDCGNGSIWVLNPPPSIWRLADHKVSSVVSGPAVCLVPCKI